MKKADKTAIYNRVYCYQITGKSSAAFTSFLFQVRPYNPIAYYLVMLIL